MQYSCLLFCGGLGTIGMGYTVTGGLCPFPGILGLEGLSGGIGVLGPDGLLGGIGVLGPDGMPGTPPHWQAASPAHPSPAAQKAGYPEIPAEMWYSSGYSDCYYLALQHLPSMTILQYMCLQTKGSVTCVLSLILLSCH